MIIADVPYICIHFFQNLYGFRVNSMEQLLNTALGSVLFCIGNRTFYIGNNMVGAMEKIKNLMIDSNSGKIPFSYVAEIKSADGPNTISRENVSRRILISCNVADRDLRGAVTDIQDKINENITFP